MRELDLRLALDQEQTLRREVDHRVKNSLASIGALLSMKARRETHLAVRRALEDASGRIRSLSALHAELHELGGDDLVGLKSLFKRIEADLRQLLPDGIALAITVSDERVGPKLANSLVLIANEFIANSAKHAFGSGSGSITVEIDVRSGRLNLVCRDDGSAGAAEVERAAASSGLGTRVIHSIASSLGIMPQWRASGNGMELRMVGTIASTTN